MIKYKVKILHQCDYSWDVYYRKINNLKSKGWEQLYMTTGHGKYSGFCILRKEG